MAFAYVRFIDDGIKRVVKTSDIKKFTPNEIDAKKKYKVLFSDDQQYYRAHIICIGDNEIDIVDEAESKRIRLPPSRFQNDDESDITEAELIDVSSVVKNKKTLKTNVVSAKYNSKLFEEIAQTTEKDYDSENQDNLIALLREEIQILKKDNLTLKNKNSELNNLNIKLQKDVLANWGEMMTALTKSVEKEEKVDSEEKPTGYRGDNRIHLGQNIWLPDQIYNSIDARSKTNGAFVRSLACAVFGGDTLATSSVTGQRCNRTKSEPGSALDPQKLVAIHDIVQHRLIQNGMNQEQARLFCTRKIDTIIASKISDLKRGPRSSKKTDENAEAVVELEAEIQLAHNALLES